MRRFSGILFVLSLSFLTCTTANAAIELYNQNFDTSGDVSGWFDFGGSISQVSSGGGTLGVASAGGSAGHAEVVIGSGTGDGAYTAFSGYSSVWPGGFLHQSLDVYIDPSAGSNGDGWYLDNAVSGNDGAWEEAGGVGALKADDGFWWVAADADGGAYQGPSSGGVGLQITTADWYTIVSEWNENGDGLTVDRDTFIYDSSGTLLYSNFNPQQVALANIGGTRYGWIAANEPTSMTLAIDNSILTVGGAVPEPISVMVWGGLLAGALIVSQRIKFTAD